jgi:hypothetical protein
MTGAIPFAPCEMGALQQKSLKEPQPKEQTLDGNMTLVRSEGFLSWIRLGRFNPSSELPPGGAAL